MTWKATRKMSWLSKKEVKSNSLFPTDIVRNDEVVIYLWEFLVTRGRIMFFLAPMIR